MMHYNKGLPRPANDGELVGIDIEMFGMDKPHRADGHFASIQIAYPNGDAYLVTDQHDLNAVISRINLGTWVMQNALFDLRVLRRYLDIPQRYVHDTMLVEKDLFGGWYSHFGLQHLARRWLRIKLEKEIRDEFQKVTEMTPELEAYAVEDAVRTVQIAQKQIDYINNELNGDFRWYYEIDEPAMWAILDMKPIRVDVDKWLAYGIEMQKEAARREAELGFNVYSHKNVKAEIQASLGRKIKNTNANETLIPLLTSLSASDTTAKLIREIVEIRRLRKASETYGETWIEQAVEMDGYVYPDWHVTGAETGRMACSNPNMQNIPKRRMPIFRTFFVASAGHSMLVSDADQQELRLSAHLSGDIVLKKELQGGADIHQITGDLFGVDRDRGKTINYGLMYGLSEYGLAAEVKITIEEARAGIKARERRYRQLTAWQGEMKKFARYNNYVPTLTGRRVYVNIYDNQWERNAINAPVQGSAADHTKLAMLVKLHQMSADRGLEYSNCGVIHDEALQDFPAGMDKEYTELTEDAWEEAGREIAPSVALPADITVGDNWGVK